MTVFAFSTDQQQKILPVQTMPANPNTTEDSTANPASQQIKILMFAPHTAVGGGVVSFTQALSRHLAPRFETEQFFIGQRPGRLGRMARPFVPLLDAFRLIRILLTRQHDVYHVNPSLVPRATVRDGFFLLILRAFGRRNVLVFIHGWDEEFYRRIAKRPVWRAFFVFTYRHADRVLVLASSFARSLETLGLATEKIRVTTTMFEGAPIQEATRNRNDADIWILFLARFIAEKGIYELLNAFQKLSECHSHVVLIMAGDGPERHGAQDWCETRKLMSRVRFPGYVGGAEKAQLLLDSDIFALPSLREGCPIALLEAMGAGLPVIVTSVGGIPDIVRDDVNGIMLKSLENDAITNALQRLVADADLRIRIGRHNREQAWQDYEAHTIASKLETEYVRIAAV